MNKKVTIQDIADALGVSRNTVSKAINNSDGLADATREKILQKAVEMGYKQFSYVNSMINFLKEEEEEIASNTPLGNIAVLMTAYVGNSHFASTLLDKIHQELTRMGYTLSIHRVSMENMARCTLPKSLNTDTITAAICIEIFGAAYSDMLCSLGKPILFVDGPARRGERSVNADQLMMDNFTEITRFINGMIERGLTNIGFIGNYDHCQSFWERYSAFRSAMAMANLPVDERFVVKFPDRDLDKLSDFLEDLDDLPDVFICANDFVAIDSMQLLARRYRNILKQVRFLGFDDSHESRIFYPSLSTVHIHSQAMSFSALHLLMTRIKEPSMDYRTIYVATDLVLRDSTEF